MILSEQTIGPWGLQIGQYWLYNTLITGTQQNGIRTGDFDTGSVTVSRNPRTSQCVFDSGWDGGDILLEGVDAWGDTGATETLTAVGAGTVEGDIGWNYITRYTNLGTRTAGSVHLQMGPRLALPQKGVEVFKENENGTILAAGTTYPTLGLYLPTGVPNSAKEFIFEYRPA